MDKEKLKTKTENLFEEYKDIKSHLEISLQFDLQKVFNKIPIGYKVNVLESGLSYGELLQSVYVNPNTLNFYVLIGSDDVFLFNTLPIELRYKVYKYILSLYQKGVLSECVENI